MTTALADPGCPSIEVFHLFVAVSIVDLVVSIKELIVIKLLERLYIQWIMFPRRRIYCIRVVW